MAQDTAFAIQSAKCEGIQYGVGPGCETELRNVKKAVRMRLSAEFFGASSRSVWGNPSNPTWPEPPASDQTIDKPSQDRISPSRAHFES